MTITTLYSYTPEKTNGYEFVDINSIDIFTTTDITNIMEQASECESITLKKVKCHIVIDETDQEDCRMELLVDIYIKDKNMELTINDQILEEYLIEYNYVQCATYSNH
jgi:hypothetical protein